jgi:flagellar hook-length control protein FliK
MDIQSISKAQKTNLFETVSAPVDNGSPESAFSALLNRVGAKFGSSAGLGGLESKLMHSNDAAHAAQADARDDAGQNAPRSLVKAKGTKSDDKDTKAAKEDDSTKTQDTKSTSDDAGTTDAADADQAQAAVQAAVAATVELPVVAEVQAATVVAVVQQAAAPEAVTGPVETVVEAAAVATEIEVAAAATVVAPEQVTKAATVVQQAAGPAVEQTKAAETGPKVAQTTAATVAADETTAATDVTTEVVKADAKTAVVKEAGPKETRSAGAVDQSQAMSRMLGDDNKIQVQVHVGGKVAANQAFNVASPYNIYSGYAATDAASTANGQVGQADAGNALVQTPKAAPEVQAAVAAPIVLPPQLQSQQTQAPAPAARADLNAPIQAVESSSASQNNAQSGFESFSGGAQRSAANAETRSTAQTATDRPQVTPQQIVDQIKVVITRAAKSGLDKVTIQLKPAELGRIDVKLEMSEDHKVRVTVTADNKETLALLQSDSPTLERTLNDAGLRTDANNLHFSLRSESDPREAQNGGGQNRSQGNGDAAAAADEIDPAFDYAAAARSRGGIDTFV